MAERAEADLIYRHEIKIENEKLLSTLRGRVAIKVSSLSFSDDKFFHLFRLNRVTARVRRRRSNVNAYLFAHLNRVSTIFLQLSRSTAQLNRYTFEWTQTTFTRQRGEFFHTH